MADAAAPSNRRQARALLGESKRRLKRRGGQLAESSRDELATCLDALQTALDEGGDWKTAGEALARSVEENLPEEPKGKIREYGESIGIAIAFALVLRAFIVEAFQIPSSSMVPTLLIGDHLFVSKFAFGVRVPFTTRYLVRWGDIERGDIVVFVFPVSEVQTQADIGILTYHLEAYRRQNGGYPPDLGELSAISPGERYDDWGQPFQYELAGDGYVLVSAGADGAFGTGDDLTNENSAFVGGVGECLDRDSLLVGKDYIKRVIGLPGDRVEMRNRVLYINGEPVDRAADAETSTRIRGAAVVSATERLDSGAEYDVYYAMNGMTDFDEIIVREGHVFAMGDNRDNSSDGRCWGQVPVENIKGSAMFIFFSRDRSTGAIRWDRFFDAVR